MRTIKLALPFALPLVLLLACGSTERDASFDGAGGSSTGHAGAFALGGSELGQGGEESHLSLGGSGPSGSGSGSSTASGGSAPVDGSGVVPGTTACSNGEDDDGDGLSDGFDPECTGIADDDESSYATGIPGDNRDGKWQDCFFDGNSGAGDDGCRYSTRCLTGELALDSKDCELTQACLDFCAPLVPNGCDCFGCCTVQTKGGDAVDVMTVASCSSDKLGDSNACPRCEKSNTCGNTCGRCELCPGKTVEDLPADCGSGSGGSGSGGSSSVGGGATSGGAGNGGGPGYTCDDGEQVCGADLPKCSVGYYCSQGCCLRSAPR